MNNAWQIMKENSKNMANKKEKAAEIKVRAL